jgi:hypothetical protein
MAADYYEQLAVLRGRLMEAGEAHLAEELLYAERGGATSSEILNDTGVILQRLIATGEAERLHLLNEITKLDELGQKLFDSTNRKY